MSKTRQPDKLRPAARRLSWCAGVAVGLVFVAAGCGSTGHAGAHSGDPLFGEYYPKGPNGQPLPPTTPTKTSAVGLPPYPTANSATSTAAIANNTNLPGGRPLAINESNGPNWTLTNTNNTATPSIGLGQPTIHQIPRDTTGPVAGATTPGAPKVMPIPSTDSRTVNPIVTAGSWTSTPSADASKGPSTSPAAPSVDVLEKALEAKGAVGLKQEKVPEGVRVSCYLPQGAGNYRYLETTAADFPSGLQALTRQVSP